MKAWAAHTHPKTFSSTPSPLLSRAEGYWKEFCVSKWIGLDNKTASTNSPWAYIREGLLSGGFLCLRFGGLFSAGLNFFFFGGGRGGGREELIVGILRYFETQNSFR